MIFNADIMIMMQKVSEADRPQTCPLFLLSFYVEEWHENHVQEAGGAGSV
jgi:hypothetical protein